MIDWGSLLRIVDRAPLPSAPERHLATAVMLDLESRGLGSLGIAVTVRNGVVTLTGLCPSAEACEAVVSAVLQVPGVSSVHDLLDCTTA